MHYLQYLKKKSRGFTLVELVVTIGIFALLAASILGIVSALQRTTIAAREKLVLSSMASEYMEVVRNMPYSKVGTLTGNPSGNLPDCPVSSQPSCPKAYTKTIEGVAYKIFYEVTFIDDPADNLATTPSPNTDLEAADYKQVRMNVLNTSTGKITDFITTIVPAGLEGMLNAGALSIKVVNAQGQPVVGATIHIQSPTSSPTLTLDRTSDSTGSWTEVGLPAKVNNYRIVVTKAGYSTDQTYPSTLTNPNPTKPDATIVDGQVTQVTFAIDLVSNLILKTQNKFCSALNGVGMNVVGAKLIGTSPDVPKFSQLYFSGPPTFTNGEIALTGIEWDTYTPKLAPGQDYNVIGTSPIQKIDVLPNTSQTFTIILDGPATTYNLLVIVKDASTLAPLEGVSIHLQKGGSLPQDYYGTTGGSVWLQKDWSGGSGVPDWNPSGDHYYQVVGSIFINTGNGSNDFELAKAGNNYIPNATSTLESSTFDAGSDTASYTTIDWAPQSQDPSTFLGFQLASNNDKSTWNFIGPDGTNQTYYTTPGTGISSLHANKRYMSYKAFLLTKDPKKTPVVSSIRINYVSGCFAPGQAFFPNLTPSSGNAYDAIVSLPGYISQTVNWIDIGEVNPPLEILMYPQ